MAYEWKDGEVITAEKLNNTGGGVLIVKSAYDKDKSLYVLDKTYGELYDAFTNGTTILVQEIFESEAQYDEQTVLHYDEQYNIVKNFDLHHNTESGDKWYGSVNDYSTPDCNTREELMNSYPYMS